MQSSLAPIEGEWPVLYCTPVRFSARVINASDKVLQIDNHHEMLNVGWTNPSPWNTFRECNEEEMARRIEEQIAQLKDVKNSIFQLHAPPYGSGLDEAPELDGTLKPVYGAR